MIVCGIDPSLSSTGIAFYDTKKKKLYSGCIKTDPSKGFEPLFSLALRVAEYIKKHKPKIIAIEHPIFYEGRIRGAMRVFYFHALLRCIIYQNHKKSELYEYWPTAWKKKFTGNGHSTKEEVIKTALSRYRYKFSNFDQADAFGIMRAALSDFRIAKSLKQQSGGDEKGAETNIESMQRSGIAQTADENELRVYRKVKKRIFRKRPA